MNKWPYIVGSWLREEIHWAITDDDWQSYRKSLKGLTTQDKLQKLELYLLKLNNTPAKIRVDNYINALKRGGQLNMNLEVVR